jgi:GNAT superfamily N-acetyltransferase
MPDVTLRPEPLDSPAAGRLIPALNAELSGRYPEAGANHFQLDPEAVGCGAVRRLDAGTAEIKRMFVVPALRGQGIAGRVLAALEDEARALGVERLVLETGVRQPDAIALYRRFGFADIPAFGEYIGSALSVCMGKALATSPPRRT